MKPYTGQNATVMLKHKDRQNDWQYPNKHNYNILRVLSFLFVLFCCTGTAYTTTRKKVTKIAKSSPQRAENKTSCCDWYSIRVADLPFIRRNLK